MERVGGSTAIGLKTLIAIGLIRRRGDTYEIVLTEGAVAVPPADSTDSEDESGPPQGESSFSLTDMHQELQDIRYTQQRHGEDLTRLIQGQQDLLRGQQDLLALLQPPPFSSWHTDTSAPPASADDWDTWD